MCLTCKVIVLMKSGSGGFPSCTILTKGGCEIAAQNLDEVAGLASTSTAPHAALMSMLTSMQQGIY